MGRRAWAYMNYEAGLSTYKAALVQERALDRGSPSNPRSRNLLQVHRVSLASYKKKKPRAQEKNYEASPMTKLERGRRC